METTPEISEKTKKIGHFGFFYSLGTANSACPVFFYARISGIQANPLNYTDPDGNDIIVNKSDHYVIVRGEKGQTHTVRPGETYNTKDHNLDSIDGVIFNNGQLYKTKDGNGDATFTISEKSGVYKVRADLKGIVVNAKGDIMKSLANKALVEAFSDDSISRSVFDLPGKDLEERLYEFSGMRDSMDNSISQRQWPSDYQEHIMGNPRTPIDNWDKDLVDFKTKYPNGYNDVK
jgi:hypothetical protein